MSTKTLPIRTLGVALVLTLGLALGLAAPAEANHAVQLDEVMAGAFGRPEIQFVEVKLADCAQGDWEGIARLVAFDAADQVVGEHLFPADAPVDCGVTRQSILIGTQAFADLASAPDPDFLIPPLLAPRDGKVCFLTSIATLCLSYGRFLGNSQQGSADNAPALSPEGICALQRDAFFGDFTSPSFNEDFALAAPAPRNGLGTAGTVAVPPRFIDVPASSPFRPFVEALFNQGITGGCGGGAFCPQVPVSRSQMAVFLLLALEGPGFQPPPCEDPVFTDVPCSNPFAPWIQELAARGITGGCGGGAYCPEDPVTREQMAVFLLAAADGPAAELPVCAEDPFDDVPCSSPFAPWIQELAARGVTGGCSGSDYCPGDPVTREQMAVFLSVLFELPVPSASCPAP